jgi:hypothetical protein
MVAIRGGICGPDPGEVDGAYLNEIETDRSAFWYALGAKNGVLNGLTYTGVPGVMALDIEPGSGLVSERDASGDEQARGYFVWSDATVTVTFGAASASARNDAVVVAFVDIEDGAVGTGALDVGPQVVVVPGTSGITTAVTAADITAYLGRGGWFRLLNVPILPAATQIATGTIESVAYQSRGWNTLTLSPSTGWTISGASYRITTDGLITLQCQATRTGANIVAGVDGNIGNSSITTLPSSLRPLTSDRFLSFEVALVATYRGLINTSGVIMVTHLTTPSQTLSTGDVLQIHGSYYL